MKEKIKQIYDDLDNLHKDSSMPRSVRRGAEEAKQELLKEGDQDIRIASAISTLDEIASDPNIPSHGRISLWNIMSRLESTIS